MSKLPDAYGDVADWWWAEYGVVVPQKRQVGISDVDKSLTNPLLHRGRTKIATIASNQQLSRTCSYCNDSMIWCDDWLCRRCRLSVDQFMNLGKKEPLTHTRRKLAKDLIALASRYVENAQPGDLRSDLLLLAAFYRAKEDREALASLLRKTGRPRKSFYDEAYRLVTERGFTIPDALKRIQEQFPEAADVTVELLSKAVKKRKLEAID